MQQDQRRRTGRAGPVDDARAAATRQLQQFAGRQVNRTRSSAEAAESVPYKWPESHATERIADDPSENVETRVRDLSYPGYRKTGTCSSIAVVAAGSLGTTAEQRALADAIAGYATHARLIAEARALAESEQDALPASWSSLVAQELLALPFDASVVDVAVAAEELGRALAPGPVLSTLVAALLVRRHGNDVLRARVEHGLRDGTFAASVLVGDVLWGGAAVTVVVLPLAGRWVVADADALDLVSHAGIDATRRVATTTTGSLQLDADDELPGLSEAEVRDTVATLVAAESAGIAGWCVDTATDYAKVREQFGRPIGAFQAVKHRCADMLAQLELARAAAWDAATAVDHELDEDIDADARALAVAVAAATAPAAAVECAKSCIQILGGIGFTWEHDAHLYLRRLLSNSRFLGSPSEYFEQVGRQLVRRTT